MRTQQVARGGIVRFDKRTGDSAEEPGTYRDLLVKPSETFVPPGPVTQSPAILSRAEIARRRDANR
jgi:hypothetical protein